MQWNGDLANNATPRTVLEQWVCVKQKLLSNDLKATEPDGDRNYLNWGLLVYLIFSERDRWNHLAIFAAETKSTFSAFGVDETLHC